MGTDVGDQRERLELEDFEVPENEKFDPVAWLNARLARGGGVPFDRLDRHLSSLGMSCQLLCQDASESVEVASNQLVAQLPTTARDVEKMQQEALKGRGRLCEVLEGLKDADDRKQTGLHRLADIDAVKTRVETACSALREVGSWERRIKDCEQLVNSGNLPPALAQLTSLKEVLDAFRMLPEYGKKEEQLGQLEDNLLKTARRRARHAAERGAIPEIKGCCEVLAGLGKPNEPVALANAVFQELAEKAWEGQHLRADASAGELAAAARCVFDSFVQTLDDRRELLKLLDSLTVSPSAASTPVTSEVNAVASPATSSLEPPQLSSAASAARAALLVLGSAVESQLATAGASGQSAAVEAAAAPGEEGSSHARAARALAFLAAYVDGFEALARTATVCEAPELIVAICQNDNTVGSQVLPWTLLREVLLWAVLRPMQDEVVALAPVSSGGGAMRPSEAVLAAETSARRMMQLAGTWAQRLEQQGVGRLGVPWLVCMDETCAAYWRQWGPLFDTFRNTMAASAGGGAAANSSMGCTFDASLLNECMQLHGMLHGTIPAAFASFQVEALQHAKRMAGATTAATSGSASTETAFSRALSEKIGQDPSVCCEHLGHHSPALFKAAWARVHGGGLVASLGSPTSPTAVDAGTAVLPSTLKALRAAEKEACALVTQCCVQPVAAILGGYPQEIHWTRVADESALVGLLPLQQVTAVGEHLFSLVPQLERSQDSSQFQWLPIVLEAVVETVLMQALQIEKMTPFGAQQLIVDMEYVQKVTDALGSSDDNTGGGATAATTTAPQPQTLKDFLEALSYLASQQRRKQESVTKGEAFVEEARDGPPLSRRFERSLRSLLGLSAH